jgi:hypothetical protein
VCSSDLHSLIIGSRFRNLLGNLVSEMILTNSVKVVDCPPYLV